MENPDSSVRWIPTFVVALLCAAPAFLWAAVPSGSCDRPSLPSDSAVNVVVLPYQIVAGDSVPLLVTSDRLSQLIELEVADSTLKYRNVGVIRLIGREGICNEEEVLTKLLDAGSPEAQPRQALRPDGAVVIVWGRLYEEGDDIFVQTYVRFLRPSGDEELRLKIGNHELIGRLPAQVFALPPRHLTQRDLLHIRERFAESTILIRDFTNLAAGTLPPINDSAPLLREKMPEMDLIVGVVGYLRYRVGPSSRDIANRAETALRRYSEAADREAEATAAAGAQSLLGFLAFLRSPDAESGLRAAHASFETAADLAPENGEARNLGLLAKLYSIYLSKEAGVGSREIAEDLLNAVSLDPENPSLRRNIADFYRFLEELGPPSETNPHQLAAAEITTTLAALGEPNSKVLAIVNGTPITEAEVLAHSTSQFALVEQTYRSQQHKLLEDQLKSLIEDRLVEEEANARRTSEEQLLASIETAEVTEVQIDQFYEENKARIPQPREQARDQIRQYLEGVAKAEARQKLLDQLEAKYPIELKLDPFRTEVAASGPAKGPANAPVTIVEFSDFQCPFCSRINPTLEQVRAKYGDKVRIVFRQFPLGMHPQAQKAAEASLCAYEQGKFWKMHDAMFKSGQTLSVANLKATAASLGLQPERFNTCLDSDKYAAQVQLDRDAGAAAGVSGAPAIFINGRFISGAVPFESITAVIEDELKRRGLAIR